MVLDIKSAFLYGETKRAIYLELPMQDRNAGNPELVGKRHKALYGTCDARSGGKNLSTTYKDIDSREIICMLGVFQLDEQKVTLVVHVLKTSCGWCKREIGRCLRVTWTRTTPRARSYILGPPYLLDGQRYHG